MNGYGGIFMIMIAGKEHSKLDMTTNSNRSELLINWCS